MTGKASDPINASTPKAYANLYKQKTDSPKISRQKEALKMEKNTRSRNSRIQKTNGTATVGVVKNDGDSPAIEAMTQTPLEARFTEARTNLSASRQRLLRRILDEPHEAYFLSSREMARRYEVDSATIVRTVQAMGYPKFADFAHDLRAHFVTQITPYMAMKAAAQKNRSVADYVHQSIEKDLENLNALKAGLDVNKVAELAKQIHRTRRIIVVGIDFAASLAMSLAYGLVRLGCDAEAPTGSTGVVQNKVRIMTEKDLLIAISFGQGLRETVEAVQRARRQGVPTFGITDTDKTPIARFCDQYILASIARTSFIDSYVASVAAINAILVACAHSQPKRALELLAQTEKEYNSGARWYLENEDSNQKTR
ncbi:MAG: MurR/RpiR family transcriptional regulator [Acidobacteria bacterium]|nr:MurR/RpiR family transcriptional regulator [Acidobacteriota bacterium]